MHVPQAILFDVKQASVCCMIESANQSVLFILSKYNTPMLRRDIRSAIKTDLSNEISFESIDLSLQDLYAQGLVLKVLNNRWQISPAFTMTPPQPSGSSEPPQPSAHMINRSPAVEGAAEGAVEASVVEASVVEALGADLNAGISQLEVAAERALMAEGEAPEGEAPEREAPEVGAPEVGAEVDPSPAPEVGPSPEPVVKVRATVNSLALMKKTIESNIVADVSFVRPPEAKIDVLKLSRITLSQDITFINCHFDYLYLLEGSYKGIHFKGCHFHGPITIEKSLIEGEVSFEGSEVAELIIKGKSQVSTTDPLSAMIELPALTFTETRIKTLDLSTAMIPQIKLVKSTIKSLNADRLNHIGPQEKAWAALNAPLERTLNASLSLEEGSCIELIALKNVYLNELSVTDSTISGLLRGEGNLIKRVTLQRSSLTDALLYSECPAFELNATRSYLKSCLFDLSKSNLYAPQKIALALTQESLKTIKTSVLLQENLITSVLFKLNGSAQLRSLRDIISVEYQRPSRSQLVDAKQLDALKGLKDLSIYGGEFTELTFSELYIDSGYLSLESLKCEESSIDARLANLSPSARDAAYVKAKNPQGAEGAPPQQGELICTEGVITPSVNKSIWGLRAKGVDLGRVLTLNLPVRDVRLYDCKLRGVKPQGSAHLRWPLPSQELTIKGSEITGFDISSAYEGESRGCEQIKIERSTLSEISLHAFEASLVRLSSCKLSQVYIEDISFKRSVDNKLGLILFMCDTVNSHEEEDLLVIRRISVEGEGVVSLDRSELHGVTLAHIKTPRFDLKSARLINAELSHINTRDFRLWRIPTESILISPYLINKGKEFIEVKSDDLSDISGHVNRAQPYCVKEVPYGQSNKTYVIAGQGIKDYITDVNVVLIEPRRDRRFQNEINEYEGDDTAARLRDHYPVIELDSILLKDVSFTKEEQIPANLLEVILYQLRDLYEGTILKNCVFKHCELEAQLQEPPKDGKKKSLSQQIEELDESGQRKIIKRPLFESVELSASKLIGPILKGISVSEKLTLSQGTSLEGPCFAHAQIDAVVLIDDCTISGEGTFESGRFHQRCSVQDSTLQKDALRTFDNSEFFDDLTLNHLCFEKTLSLRGVNLSHSLNLTQLILRRSESHAQSAEGPLEFEIDLSEASCSENIMLRQPRYKSLEVPTSQGPARVPARVIALKVNLDHLDVKQTLDIRQLSYPTWADKQRAQKSAEQDSKGGERSDVTQSLKLSLRLLKADKMIIPELGYELRRKIKEAEPWFSARLTDSPPLQPIQFYSAKLERGVKGAGAGSERQRDAKLALEHYEWLELFEKAAQAQDLHHEVGYYIHQQTHLLRLAQSRLYYLNPLWWAVRLIQGYQLNIYKVSGEKSWMKFTSKLLLIAAVFFCLHRFALNTTLSDLELLTLVSLEAWLSPVLNLLDINIESLESMQKLDTLNQIAHAAQRLLSILLLAPLLGLSHQLITHERIAQKIRNTLRSQDR